MFSIKEAQQPYKQIQKELSGKLVTSWHYFEAEKRFVYIDPDSCSTVSFQVDAHDALVSTKWLIVSDVETEKFFIVTVDEDDTEPVYSYKYIDSASKEFKRRSAIDEPVLKLRCVYLGSSIKPARIEVINANAPVSVEFVYVKPVEIAKAPKKKRREKPAE